MQDQGIHASRHFGFAVAPATLMAMARASSASGGRIRSAAGAVQVRGTLHSPGARARFLCGIQLQRIPLERWQTCSGFSCFATGLRFVYASCWLMVP